MSYGDLDSRKLQILKAIIDDYIESVEPVGSRTLAKKYDMGLSSATIRNEMADLEEMGYLSQPHTSAGRIPSDKGYRLYVDKLIDFEKKTMTPSLDELEKLKQYMERRINELNSMIRVATEIISRLTQYTSIAITGSQGKHTIKALQIVPVEKEKILIVLVLDDDEVKNKLINVSISAGPDKLISLSSMLNDVLVGRSSECIDLATINSCAAVTGIKRETILSIVDSVTDMLSSDEEAHLYTEGTSRMLTHPEFNDIDKARKLLDLLNKEDVLINLLKSCQDAGGLVVKIGSENAISEINDCSVITATYCINGINLGTIGVLGPTRMDYKRVIAALEYVRRKLLS